jgi:hypothetical protein
MGLHLCTLQVKQGRILKSPYHILVVTIVGFLGDSPPSFGSVIVLVLQFSSQLGIRIPLL